MLFSRWSAAVAVVSRHAPACAFFCTDAIGSPALGDRRGLFSIRPDVFEQQMDHLSAEFGASVVGLDPDLSIVSNAQIAISFDDGYQDNLEVAAPILVARGLPFTMFVTADFVRNSRPGFLTPSGLRELAAVPKVRIGAHGATHVALSECDDAQLRDELHSSKRYLEDTIGREVCTMAFPYGAANHRVRDAVAAAGYRLAASSYACVNDAKRDRLMLGRTEVLGGDSRGCFVRNCMAIGIGADGARRLSPSGEFMRKA